MSKPAFGWLIGKTATRPLSRRVRHGRKSGQYRVENGEQELSVRFLRATIVEWCAQGGGSFSLFSRADLGAKTVISQQTSP